MWIRFYLEKNYLLMSRYDYVDPITFFKLVHVAEKAVNNYHNKAIIFYHIHNYISMQNLILSNMPNLMDNDGA